MCQQQNKVKKINKIKKREQQIPKQHISGRQCVEKGSPNLMRMWKKPGSNNWSDSLPHTHTPTQMDWVSSMN